ncbi:hypothetical protein PIB30_055141 [Stylosanthes scabra]|uniref:Uncharacterized protein n=1 Tax=Stylosanthes scabra TaxID=79078 RepID=A0ABU6QJP3_9FABA|nr:hypothetical protein [Stylosanthes scabra]
MLTQQKAGIEKEKVEAEKAKSKAEEDLAVSLTVAKEKDVELQRLRDREAGFLADLELAKKKLSEKKSRADKAESSLAATEQARLGAGPRFRRVSPWSVESGRRWPDRGSASPAFS